MDIVGSRANPNNVNDPNFWYQCAEEQRQIAQDYVDETKDLVMRHVMYLEWMGERAEKRRTAA